MSTTAIPRLGPSGPGHAARRGGGTALRAAVLLATAALVLGACSTGSDSASSPPAAQPEQVAPGEGSSDATRQDAADGGAGSAGPVSETLSVPVADRSVVYTVDVVVRVDDVPAAAAQAAEVAAAYDGYVQSESSYGSDSPRPVEPVPYDPAVVLPPAGQGQAVLVLRVPAERYADAVADLEDLGQTVSRSRSAQDVTEEVVDVQARIETQQAAIARLEELLAEATTVSDVLAVEAQLTTRVAELESLQARQQQLGDLTTLATITATFVPPEAVVEEGTGFVAGLQAGWRAFLRSVELGLTAVGALLPFALFFALLLVPLAVWLVLRSRRQRRARAAAAGVPPVPAAPPQ